MPRGPITIFKITSESAEIRWNSPENTGGLPLSSYIIEIREATKSYWRRAATVNAKMTSYTITNLNEGTEYIARVIAKNPEGESLPLTSDFIAISKAKCEYLFQL